MEQNLMMAQTLPSFDQLSIFIKFSHKSTQDILVGKSPDRQIHFWTKFEEKLLSKSKATEN